MTKMMLDEIKDLDMESANELIGRSIIAKNEITENPDFLLSFLGRQDWMTDEECKRYGIDL